MMLVSELYSAFRSDVSDVELPYLWSDDEVYGYMNEALTMFARLTGGIPDATSAVTLLAVTAGQARTAIDRRIMRVRNAVLESSKASLAIYNVESSPQLTPGFEWVGDYRAGPVRGVVLGEDAASVRWVHVPQADDSVRLSVYRLPLKIITEDSAETDLAEIPAHHHRSLLIWMKHLAYAKQDTEAFNKTKSSEMGQQFERYCVLSSAEISRQQSKVRVVRYGGL